MSSLSACSLRFHATNYLQNTYLHNAAKFVISEPHPLMSNSHPLSLRLHIYLNVNGWRSIDVQFPSDLFFYSVSALAIRLAVVCFRLYLSRGQKSLVIMEWHSWIVWHPSWSVDVALGTLCSLDCSLLECLFWRELSEIFEVMWKFYFYKFVSPSW